MYLGNIHKQYIHFLQQQQHFTAQTNIKERAYRNKQIHGRLWKQEKNSKIQN